MDPLTLWDELVVVSIFLRALEALYAAIASAGIPSWGVTIVAFTMIVKTLTLPLTLKSMRSMKRMQMLQPELQALQKQFKGDKEKLMQEQMRLYRENNVNPVAGCLPMLVQMPVWLALYGALLHLTIIDANGVAAYPEFMKPFLWLPNLGLPEFTGENFPYQLWPLPILAVLTAVTQWMTTRMSIQPTTDPQQQTMNTVMQYMPIMFFFFSLQVPAGLVLYWVASNCYQLVQQYFLTGWGQLWPSRARPIPVYAGRVAAVTPRRDETATVEPVEQGAQRANRTPSNSGRRRRNKRR